MADQVTMKARSIVGRVLDPTLSDQITKRGRAFVESASERAATTWRDAEPIRREASRAGSDALSWGRRTWRNDMQPRMSRLWSNRTAALGAAGAAVPIARELFDDAAVRLGIRARRERRHWGTFFAGLLLGAAAGIIAAILTAPKAGREMRDELATTARDAATRALEVASRAREAAASATEWVPIFQRPVPGSEAEVEPAVETSQAPETVRPASTRKRPPTGAPVSESELLE